MGHLVDIKPKTHFKQIGHVCYLWKAVFSGLSTNKKIILISLVVQKIFKVEDQHFLEFERQFFLNRIGTTFCTANIYFKKKIKKIPKKSH